MITVKTVMILHIGNLILICPCTGILAFDVQILDSWRLLRREDPEQTAVEGEEVREKERASNFK